MANTFIFDDDEQPDMGMSPTPEQDDDQPEEGEGSNRTFLLILGGIGVLFLLSVLCVGGYFLLRPGGPINQASLSAGTGTPQVLASPTLAEVQESETPLPVATEEATATPVIVAFATDTALVSDLPTDDPATATLQAQLTELAALQQAQTTATVTSLPKATTPAKGGSSSSGGVGATPTAKIPQTGFADEVALPIMGIVTVLLLGIILLARRLRTSPER